MKRDKDKGLVHVAENSSVQEFFFFWYEVRYHFPYRFHRIVGNIYFIEPRKRRFSLVKRINSPHDSALLVQLTFSFQQQAHYSHNVCTAQ